MALIGKLGIIGRLQVFWKVLRDRRTPTWAKVLFVLASLLYAVIPLDFDWLPIVGWIDDVMVVSFLAWLLTRLAPKATRQEAVAEVLAKVRGVAGRQVEQAPS